MSEDRVRRITSFETGNPFDRGQVVSEHATDGQKALRLDSGYAALHWKQDWTGYDYIKADVHTDAKKPLRLNFEVRDRETTGYWTRVNYNTIVPPGSSTLTIPTALFVGEKSRPGRPLILDGITRMVFAIGNDPEAPLFIENIRLERETQLPEFQGNGFWAFDLGVSGSPVMEGFTPLDADTAYDRQRGYGWKNARFWRSFDALQPDPLYQDFICVQRGGLAIDLPNGKYHVFVNMDSPSGYWGEYQRYEQRALILEGQRYVDDMSDFDQFVERYYRFWDSEDLPSDNTFDKYQRAYFNEKQHEVLVRDGQLNIEFAGENWACCVSAIIVYPDSERTKGEEFLDDVAKRRRFHFDNYFKRTLHVPEPTAWSVDSPSMDRGYTVFSRDWMDDVYYNDQPRDSELIQELSGGGFAGEYEPVTFSVLPHRDLETVRVSVSDLQGPANSIIRADEVDIGFVQYRISRVTMEGSVYTIAPRLIIPEASVDADADIARRFWLTVRIPPAAKPGQYRGSVQIAAQQGQRSVVPLKFTVRTGTLDPVDIPVGPWGHTINLPSLPWNSEQVSRWNDSMAVKSLRKLREYGFTTASGLPVVTYRGFRNGVATFDFSRGDAQMKRFRESGFSMPVASYCAFNGLNTYYKDEEAMRAAGFRDYAEFIKALFTSVQRHADQANWLPVYWNIGDEPIGDNLRRSFENAAAYREAFPQGPPYFTAASSFRGSDTEDLHFKLSKALHVAAWNNHDETGVRLLQKAGGDWAFYNGGNRWTYGVYMFKAAREFDMQYRLTWHWNIVAGDPYYALDCREDDYAWCNSNPAGELIPSLQFERLREGLDDYRRMLTLDRLARQKPDAPPAKAARKLLDDILGSFQLGDRELKGYNTYPELRADLDAALEALR